MVVGAKVAVSDGSVDIRIRTIIQRNALLAGSISTDSTTSFPFLPTKCILLLDRTDATSSVVSMTVMAVLIRYTAVIELSRQGFP